MGPPIEMEDRSRPEAAPGSEQTRYQPRFRVVTRKPLAPAASARVSPNHRASLLAAFPAVCLLIYVMFWTLAVRGGYYKAQLQDQLQTLKVEQAELQADKLLRQSPGTILSRAQTELGMQAAVDTEFSVTRTADPMARVPAAAAPIVRQARGTETDLTR